MENTEREGSDEGDLVNRSTKKVRDSELMKEQQHWMSWIEKKILNYRKRMLSTRRSTNKVFSLGKLSQPFRLMDVENGYFLAKFKNSEAYEKVLRHGHWVIRLLGLLGHMYKRKILREIRGIIGKVAKLEFNTGFGKRVIQRNDYEYLPIVCFLCGHYGHIKEICPRRVMGPDESGEGISENMSEHRQNMGLNIEEAPPNPSTYGP
ncbi:hypothetical protein Gotri_001542 [Gossypium trilobum]|uniref:CCHC-type domain-containing protein n=1 Tax=Gossypium trilobum TaxID=34281 RepID=A0A7J9FFG1_9ROSI|nr:hypothetical protein [Gossypium trilobum]